MKATDILMEEHRVIEGVLATLEAAATSLERGQDVRPGFFEDAGQFIKGFADGCHHRKEEGVLFKALVANGMSATSGPIAVMLAEHEQGRVLTRSMREAAAQLGAGDAAARQAVVRHALEYVALLRQHIVKEDHVLFPLADRVIPPAGHAQVDEGFEHVEHEETGAGVHEKYLGLAAALDQEVRSKG